MNNLTLAITTIGDLLLEGRITRKRTASPLKMYGFPSRNISVRINGLHAMLFSCLMISPRLGTATRRFIG